ncbi:hypothetical protein FB639_001368 [Coemansia asiatica]|nr:hypothetical protein FB639_001368 [Coemansia asiatica]
MKSKDELSKFAHQVAGHGDILHTRDKKVLIKPLDARETKFYKGAANQPLNAFFPAFHGTTRLDKSNDRENSNASEPAQDTHICIENLVTDYVLPCIMDIKIGTQLYDLDATPEKRARMELHAKRRTSAELGYAPSGLVFAGQPTGDRAWLYDLTKETVVTEAFVPFFNAAQAALDTEHRDLIVEQVIDWLVAYRDMVKVSETRMFGSSVLVVFEADRDQARKARMNNQSLVTVRAIDFAHSHWTPGQGPDCQYLFGLDNLIRTLQGIFSIKK